MRLKDLTLREKVYKTFIMNVNHMRSTGTLKEYFEKYPIGGLYFSKGAVQGLIEMKEGDSVVSSEFVKACRRASKYPLVVCADGANIGDTGLPACDTEALGAADSEELAYCYGKALGMQMNANDVDWLLGPCIDMPLSRTMDTVCSSMSNDPEVTTKIYSQVVKGLQDQNVAATVKHFPGIGTHHVNMHLAPGKNVLPFEEWMKTYGYTYQKMFEAGAMCTMTSHISLNSYSDKSDFGGLSIATYSKDLTLGLLKEKLGFDGVVVTDAMTMGGCSVGDQIEQAVAAFACGADFILWPPIEAGERIIEELESGRIPMERLDDAIERIQRFLDRLGIDEKEREFPEIDAAFVDDVMKETIRKGITLVRNKQGNLPITAEKKRILVDLVAPQVTKNVTNKKLEHAEYFTRLLSEQGFEVDFKWNYTNFFEAYMKEEIAEYDAIVVLLDTPLCAGVFKDCFNSVWSVHLLPMEKKVIVNFGSPFFIDDYYPQEETFVQVNSEMNRTSVEAVVDAILGKREMTGKLQVKVRI
ncbi:MAG: hypothetical protein IKK59_00820 [Lachnospiraceae bacterium]|nr:hypothetical protein [Lachnospiraceae bacterium]